MTRILLAEDQQVVRQALRCLIEREADLEVVGEAADGLEVLPLAERLKPDVLITDVAMPGLYGLEVTRRVRELTPGTAVVILSRYLNEWYVTEALRSGALAYVVRQSDSGELLRAIRSAARGRRVRDPYDTLTSREREILQLVAEGYSSTGIARRLTISARTAEAHRANAMRKLRLRNQAALIRYALSRGVLPPALPLPREARTRRRGRPRAVLPRPRRPSA